jgi:hypothetical protein
MVVPFLFYFPVYIYTKLFDLEYLVHFYSDVIIDSDASLKILLAHILSGVMILSIPSYRHCGALNEAAWRDYSLIFLTMLVILLGKNSYMVYFASIVLYIIWSQLRPGYFLNVMIPMGFAILWVTGQRYFIVWIIIYVAIHLMGMSLLKLIFVSILGLILSATLLQGLKNYGEGLSILNFYDIEGLFSIVYNNIAPTYLVSYLYLDRTYSIPTILGEIIPLFKLFTGEKGMVDVVSVDFLPSELIADGSRLGSSTSMLLSDSSFHIILVIFVAILFFRYVCRRLAYFNRVVIFYLVIFGPYSVRRSVASFVFDIAVILFLCTIIIFFGRIYKYMKSENA